MTTTYQVSNKVGDKIVLVKSEDADPGKAFGDFGAALAMIGNEQAETTLQALAAALGNADPLAVAAGQVIHTNPGTAVISVPPVYAAAGQQEQWGNPPVPPMQPSHQQPAGQPYYQGGPTPNQLYPSQQQAPVQQQQPQIPAAAAPSCQHGQKKLVQGSKNGRDWKAWGCPAPKGDPTSCGLDFIRG